MELPRILLSSLLWCNTTCIVKFCHTDGWGSYQQSVTGVQAYRLVSFLFYHQRNFIFSAVISFWEKYQAELISKLKELKNVVWSGDGHFDSVGHSANLEPTRCFLTAFSKLCSLKFSRQMKLVAALPWSLKGKMLHFSSSICWCVHKSFHFWQTQELPNGYGNAKQVVPTSLTSSMWHTQLERQWQSWGKKEVVKKLLTGLKVHITTCIGVPLQQSRGLRS